MAVEVAQRSRGGGGGGGNPLGRGRAAKSHGEEIVAIIYSILLTYSASSSHFFAVANEISFVRSRRAVPLLVFLVLVLVALRCCVKIALPSSSRASAALPPLPSKDTCWHPSRTPSPSRSIAWKSVQPLAMHPSQKPSASGAAARNWSPPALRRD